MGKIGDVYAVVYKEQGYLDGGEAVIGENGNAQLLVASNPMEKVEFLNDRDNQVTEVLFAAGNGSSRTFLGRRQCIGLATFVEEEEALCYKINCDEWKVILDDSEAMARCLRDVMSFIGRNRRLTNNDFEQPGDILHGLNNVADVADRLERSVSDMKRATNGIKLISSRYTESDEDDTYEDAELEEIIYRIGDIERVISLDLVKKVESLFQRASNILSIDEAFRAREQNASIKRMSWITFIFLPLVFVASIYGMNVDVLDRKPSWYTAFYFAVPLFVVVILSVHIIKHRRTIRKWLPFRKRTGRLLERIVRNVIDPWLRWRAKRREMGRWSEAEAEAMLENGTGADSDLELEDYRHLVLSRLFVNTRQRELCLKAAVVSGCVQTVRFQLSHEPRLDLRTTWGANMCNYALENGYDEIFKLLQQAGLDVNIVDEKGVPILLCAIRRGRLSIVKEVIDMGAKLKARDSFGRTGLMIASKHGYDRIVKYLLCSTSLGKNWDYLTAKESRSGKEAIHYAAQSGVIKTIKYLLDVYRSLESSQRGSPMDRLREQDSRGRTPAMLAVTSLITIQFIQSLLHDAPGSYSDIDKSVSAEYKPLLIALSKAIKWARKFMTDTSTPLSAERALRSKASLAPADVNSILIDRTKVIEFYMSKLADGAESQGFDFLLKLEAVDAWYRVSPWEESVISMVMMLRVLLSRSPFRELQWTTVVFEPFLEGITESEKFPNMLLRKEFVVATFEGSIWTERHRNLLEHAIIEDDSELLYLLSRPNKKFGRPAQVQIEIQNYLRTINKKSFARSTEAAAMGVIHDSQKVISELSLGSIALSPVEYAIMRCSEGTIRQLLKVLGRAATFKFATVSSIKPNLPNICLGDFLKSEGLDRFYDLLQHQTDFVPHRLPRKYHMSLLNIALRHKRTDVVSMLLLEFDATYDYHCHGCTRIGEFAHPKDCLDWLVHDTVDGASSGKPTTQIDTSSSSMVSTSMQSPTSFEQKQNPLMHTTSPLEEHPLTLEEVNDIVEAHAAYEAAAELEFREALGIDPLSDSSVKLDRYEFYNEDPYHFSTSIITRSKWYQYIHDPSSWGSKSHRFFSPDS